MRHSKEWRETYNQMKKEIVRSAEHTILHGCGTDTRECHECEYRLVCPESWYTEEKEDELQ